MKIWRKLRKVLSDQGYKLFWLIVVKSGGKKFCNGQKHSVQARKKHKERKKEELKQFWNYEHRAVTKLAQVSGKVAQISQLQILPCKISLSLSENQILKLARQFWLNQIESTTSKRHFILAKLIFHAQTHIYDKIIWIFPFLDFIGQSQKCLHSPFISD